MKKLLILSAVAALSFTACKKDRDCVCTTSSTASGSTASTSTVTLVGVTKSTAKKACASGKWESTSGGTTVTNTQSCELK